MADCGQWYDCSNFRAYPSREAGTDESESSTNHGLVIRARRAGENLPGLRAAGQPLLLLMGANFPRHFPKRIALTLNGLAQCDCGLIFTSRDALAAHVAIWCSAMQRVKFKTFARNGGRLEAHPLPGHDMQLRRHPLGGFRIHCQCRWESPRVDNKLHRWDTSVKPIGPTAREHCRDVMRRWIYGEERKKTGG